MTLGIDTPVEADYRQEGEILPRDLREPITAAFAVQATIGTATAS